MRLLSALLGVAAAVQLRGKSSLQAAEGYSTESMAEASMRATSMIRALAMSHKTEYWGTVTVGTPPQEFTTIFDSGSGNLILPGSDCNAPACNAHRKYNRAASSSGSEVTAKGAGGGDGTEKKDATITFGTGQVHGNFVQDKLCFGGELGVCVDEVGFIAADQETDEPFEQCQFDGIMGLGFKDLSMGDNFNIVDVLAQSGHMPKNQFSVFLTDAGESEISFGGYKADRAASDLLWVPVTHQSYWQVGINDIAFNNVKTGLCPNCQVAVDTGTSLLAGPSDVVAKLTDQLDVKEDCSNFDQLPALGFVINDRVLNLLPEDYVDRDGGSCSLALMTLDVPPPKGPLFIFGDPFLRRFLTVYDRDGPSVGFAVANAPGADAGRIMGRLQQGVVAPKPEVAPVVAEGGADAEASAERVLEAAAMGAPDQLEAHDETEAAKEDVFRAAYKTETQKAAADADKNFDELLNEWQHKAGKGFVQVATRSRRERVTLIDVPLVRKRSL